MDRRYPVQKAAAVSQKEDAMDRPPDLRRSLLFVAGADSAAQAEALRARPDVLAQDL